MPILHTSYITSYDTSFNPQASLRQLFGNPNLYRHAIAFSPTKETRSHLSASPLINKAERQL
ncbi:MAG: hypothetical protein AB1589_43360 [Cyanobacteriota bacterium]